MKIIFIGVLLLLGACGSHVYYVVKPGDTLYSIGWRHDQDYREIAGWNGLNSPYILRPGQRLRVAPPTPVTNTEARVTRPSSDHFVSTPKQNVTMTPPEIGVQTEKKSVVSDAKSPPSSMAKEENLVWQWPTNSSTIRVFSGISSTNKGLDIYGAWGQPIYAAAHGRVVYSGSGLIGYGKLIIVKHNDTYLSAYANNEQILIKEGDEVAAGQQIARMGRIGTEKVMLHFEIRRNGKPINPIEYLPRRHLQQVEDSG